MNPVVEQWVRKAEDELRLLTRAATAFRYPGEEAGELEAKAALGVCSRARVRLLMLVQDR